MYLNKKTYVKYWDHNNGRNYNIDINKEDGSIITIDPKRITYITEEIGYWRKANAIHNWFVYNCQDGVDDCKEYFVSIEQIKILHDTCIKSIKNKKIAQKLLPPVEGFFFGSTEIDEGYIEDLNNTINICESIIKEYEIRPFDIYYQSSW